VSGLVSAVFVRTSSELHCYRKADSDSLFFFTKALNHLNFTADRARRFAVQGCSFGPGEGASALRGSYC
jgi:hypothetical protein